MQSSQVRNVGLSSNAETKRDVPAWTQDPKIFPLDWFSVSRPNIIRQTKEYVSELSKWRNCPEIKTLSKLKAVLKRIMMFLHTHTSYIDEKSLLECDLEEDLITLVSLYMYMELRVLLIKKTATIAAVTKDTNVGSEHASGLSNDHLVSDRISYWLYTVLKAHEQRVDALLLTTVYTRHTRPVLDPIFRKILSEMPDGPFGSVNYVRHMLAYKTWRERVLIKDDATSSDLSALVEQRLAPTEARSFPAPLRRCLGPGFTLKDHARPHSVNLPDACRHFMRFCREMPATAADHINFASIPLLDDDLLGDEENEVNKLMNMISDRKQRKAALLTSQGSSMHVDAFIDLTEPDTKTAVVKDTPVSAIIDLTEEDEKPTLSLHPPAPSTNKRPPSEYPYARASTAMPVPVEAHCFRSFSDNDIYLVNISCICPLRHRRECRCQQQEENKKLKKSVSERNCVNESTYRRGCFRFAFGNQYDFPDQENVHTESSSQDQVKMERKTSASTTCNPSGETNEFCDTLFSSNLSICDCDGCKTQNYGNRTCVRSVSANEFSEPSTSFAANRTNLINHLPETLDKRKISSVLNVSENQSNSDTLNCDSRQQIRKIKLPYIKNANITASTSTRSSDNTIKNTRVEIEKLCSEISALGCTPSSKDENSSERDENYITDGDFFRTNYLEETTTFLTTVPETDIHKNGENLKEISTDSLKLSAKCVPEEYSNSDRTEREENINNDSEKQDSSFEDVQETSKDEIKQTNLEKDEMSMESTIEEMVVPCIEFENVCKNQTLVTNNQIAILNNEEERHIIKKAEELNEEMIQKSSVSSKFEETVITPTEIEKITDDCRTKLNIKEENKGIIQNSIEIEETITNSKVILSSIEETDVTPTEIVEEITDDCRTELNIEEQPNYAFDKEIIQNSIEIEETITNSKVNLSSIEETTDVIVKITTELLEEKLEEILITNNDTIELNAEHKSDSEVLEREILQTSETSCLIEKDVIEELVEEQTFINTESEELNMNQQKVEEIRLEIDVTKLNVEEEFNNDIIEEQVIGITKIETETEQFEKELIQDEPNLKTDNEKEQLQFEKEIVQVETNLNTENEKEQLQFEKELVQVETNFNTENEKEQLQFEKELVQVETNLNTENEKEQLQFEKELVQVETNLNTENEKEQLQFEKELVQVETNLNNENEKEQLQFEKELVQVETNLNNENEKEQLQFEKELVQVETNLNNENEKEQLQFKKELYQVETNFNTENEKEQLQFEKELVQVETNLNNENEKEQLQFEKELVQNETNLNTENEKELVQVETNFNTENEKEQLEFEKELVQNETNLNTENEKELVQVETNLNTENEKEHLQFEKELVQDETNLNTENEKEQFQFEKELVQVETNFSTENEKEQLQFEKELVQVETNFNTENEKEQLQFEKELVQVETNFNTENEKEQFPNEIPEEIDNNSQKTEELVETNYEKCDESPEEDELTEKCLESEQNKITSEVIEETVIPLSVEENILHEIPEEDVSKIEKTSSLIENIAEEAVIIEHDDIELNIDEKSEIKVIESENIQIQEEIFDKEEVTEPTTDEKMTKDCLEFEQIDIQSTEMQEISVNDKFDSKEFDVNQITTQETVISYNDIVHSNIQENTDTIKNVNHEIENECLVNEIILNNEEVSNEEQITVTEKQSELSNNVTLDSENIAEEIVVESEVVIDALNSDKIHQIENKNTISKPFLQKQEEINNEETTSVVKNGKKRKISIKKMEMMAEDYETLNMLSRKRRKQKTKVVIKENMTHKSEELYQKPIHYKNDGIAASKRRKIRSFNTDTKFQCEPDFIEPANLDSEILPEIDEEKEIAVKTDYIDSNSDGEKPKRRRKQNLKEIIREDKLSSVHKKEKELLVLCTKLSQNEIDVFLQNKLIGELETKLTEKRNNIKKKLQLLDSLEVKPNNTKLKTKQKITINNSETSTDEQKNNKTRNKQRIRTKSDDNRENLEKSVDISKKVVDVIVDNKLKRLKRRPSKKLANKLKFFSENFNLETTNTNSESEEKPNKVENSSFEMSEDDIPLAHRKSQSIPQKKNSSKPVQEEISRNEDLTIKRIRKSKIKVYQSNKTTNRKEIPKIGNDLTNCIEDSTKNKPVSKPTSFHKKLNKFKFQPKNKNEFAIKLDEETSNSNTTIVEELPEDLTFKYNSENKPKRSIKTYSNTNKSKTLEQSEEKSKVSEALKPKNCKESDVDQFKNTKPVSTCNESNISVKNEKRVETKVPLPRAEQIKIKKYREIPTDSSNINNFNQMSEPTIVGNPQIDHTIPVCATEVSKCQFELPIIPISTGQDNLDSTNKDTDDINKLEQTYDNQSLKHVTSDHIPLIPKKLFSKKAREKILNAQMKTKEILIANEIKSKELHPTSSSEELEPESEIKEIKSDAINTELVLVNNVIESKTILENVDNYKQDMLLKTSEENTNMDHLLCNFSSNLESVQLFEEKPENKTDFSNLKLKANNETSLFPINNDTNSPILDLYKNKIKIESSDENLKEIRAFNEVISKVAKIRKSLQASRKKEKISLSENNTVSSNSKYESLIKSDQMYPWPKGLNDILEHCQDPFFNTENQSSKNLTIQENVTPLNKITANRLYEKQFDTDLDQDDMSNCELIIDTSAESSDVEESSNKTCVQVPKDGKTKYHHSIEEIVNFTETVVIDNFTDVTPNNEVIHQVAQEYEITTAEVETEIQVPKENIVENSSFNEEIEIPMSLSEETIIEERSCKNEYILQEHSVGFITEDEQMNEEVTELEIQTVDKERILHKPIEMSMSIDIGLESCTINQKTPKLGEHAVVSFVKCSVNGKHKNNKKVVVRGTHNNLEECASINVPTFEICQATESIEPEKFTAKVETAQVFTNDNPVVDNYKLCILADIAMNSVYLNTKTENNNVIEITSGSTNEVQNQRSLEKDERCFLVTFPDKVPASNKPTTNVSIINSNSEEVSVNVQKIASGLVPKGVILENKIHALAERAKNNTKTNGENLSELYASLENICKFEINKLTKTPPKQEEQVTMPIVDIPPKISEPNITFDIPNTALLHLSPDDDDFIINQNLKTETNNPLINFNLQSSNTPPIQTVQDPVPPQNIDLDSKVVKILYNVIDSLNIDQKLAKKESDDVTTKEIEPETKPKPKSGKNKSSKSSSVDSGTSYLLNMYKSNCDFQNKSEVNTQQSANNISPPSYIRSSRPKRVVTSCQLTTIKRNNNVLKDTPVEEPAKKISASEKVFDKLLEEHRKEMSEAKLKNETALNLADQKQHQNPEISVDKPETNILAIENNIDNANNNPDSNINESNHEPKKKTVIDEKILSVDSLQEIPNIHESNTLTDENEEEKTNEEIDPINKIEANTKDAEEIVNKVDQNVHANDSTIDKNIIDEISSEKEAEMVEEEVVDSDNRSSAIEVVQDWFNRVDNKNQQESYSEITTYQTIEDCNFFEEVSNSCENSPNEQKSDEKIFTEHQTPDSGIFDEDSVQKDKSLDAQTPLQENISDCETYYQPDCAPTKTYFCNVTEIDSSDNIQEEIQITDVRLVKPTESCDISNMRLKVSIALERIQDIIPLLTKYKLASSEHKNKKRKEQNQDLIADVKKRKYTMEDTSVKDSKLKKRKFSADDNVIEDYVAEEIVSPVPNQKQLPCTLRTKGSVKEYPDCLFGITESPVPSGSFHSPYPSDISLTEEPTFYEEGGIDLCNDYPVYDSFEVLKEQQSLIQKETFVVDDNPKDVQPGLQAGYSVIDSQFLPLSEYMNDGDYILIDNIIFNDKRMVPVNMHQVQPETKPHNSEEAKRSEFDDSEKEDSLSETVDEIIKNPNLFSEQSTSEVHVISMDQDTSEVQVVIACEETETSSDTYLYGIPVQTEQINNETENISTTEVQQEIMEVETLKSSEQVDFKSTTPAAAVVSVEEQQPSMEILTAEISEPVVNHQIEKIPSEVTCNNDLQSHTSVETQDDFSKSYTSASNISFETNKHKSECQISSKKVEDRKLLDSDSCHSKSPPIKNPPKLKNSESSKIYQPKPIKYSSREESCISTNNSKRLYENNCTYDTSKPDSKRTLSYSKINDIPYKDRRSIDYQNPRKYNNHKPYYSDVRKPISKPYYPFNPKQYHSDSKTHNQKVPDAFDRLKQEDRSRYVNTERRDPSRYQSTGSAQDNYKRGAPYQDKSRLSQSAYTEPSPKTTYRMPPSDPSYRNSHHSNYKIEDRRPEVRNSCPENRGNHSSNNSSTHEDWLNNSTLLSLIKTANTIYKKKY